MAYMESAIPVASDFIADEFFAFLNLIHHPPQMHRKLWEWAFILHHAEREGKVGPGMKGLGFGVGLEKLPSIFAARGCSILATDAPTEVGAQWKGSGEYSSNLDQCFFDFIVDRDTFIQKVAFEICDMKDIPSHLRNFDFCWSACALEHLGSIEAGFEFIENSLKTLKPGGIALNTTELNLTSDTETVTQGPTVLYRRSDIEAFRTRLKDEGHKVRCIMPTVGPTAFDQHVDFPPYSHNPHLKLEIMNYISTSMGLIIERGR